MSGNDILQLKTVEMHPEPAVSGLHLIGDAHAARRAHASPQHTQRKDILAEKAAVLQRWDSSRRCSRRGFCVGLSGSDARSCPALCVLLARARNAGFERAAVYIGESDHVHPGRPARCARSVSFVGTDVSERGRVAVIGGIEHDEIDGSRMGAREAQGKLVRLTPGVHEVAYLEWPGQRRRQILGKALKVRVQIARIGVKKRHLLGCRSDNFGMAVADVRHIVVGVEVASAGMVEEILHHPAHDMQRLTIAQGQSRTDQSAAGGEQRLRRVRNLAHEISHARRNAMGTPLFGRTASCCNRIQAGPAVTSWYASPRLTCALYAA